MAGYSPLKITGMTSGLVQSRENFLLPDDAYPTLQNAYVWRERILRKQGYQLLGRLQRNISAPIGTTGLAGNFSGNIKSILSLPSIVALVPGGFSATIGGTTISEPVPPNGNLLVNGVLSLISVINWVTGDIAIASGVASTVIDASVNYYPNLPVMGIRTRELQNSETDQTIFFDQVYAYIFSGNAFQEFIPGTTWNAHNGDVTATDFFWSTNYWVSQTPIFITVNRKLFWVTNNTGQFGSPDPIRVTDGTTWVDFVPPNFGQIDATNFLVQCLSFLPFRGRLVAFNTWEGAALSGSLNYSNRIRWSTIGNPFIPYAAGPPATGSWRDDIRGQGGFLDIPTSEDIISVGFVRDNLVIYCERSTWQLRYTGRSIAPFQIERVNSELGGEGPFSAIQFDTSLVGIGDKGVVECDSYKSERIDIKIPDFVFEFSTLNDANFRVHGVRNFIKRLAFWTVPLQQQYDARIPAANRIYPNTRMLYNYENDSWALFNDSLTALGTYQPQSSRTWLNTNLPWVQCNFSWVGSLPAGIPAIVGGNQQGFIEYLDQQTVNDSSLYISDIVGNGIAGTPITGNPTVVTSPYHNMNEGFIIRISGIPTGTPFSNLNGGIFSIVLGDSAGLDPTNKFQLFVYNPASQQFNTPQLDVPPGTYIGGGLINIRENFSIVSKKFNFLDEGQSIQMGYLDILMDATEQGQPGAISLNVYLDYNDYDASNTLPENTINNGNAFGVPDTFFNSIIPTTSSNLNTKGGSKFWQRVFCPTRANFLTLQYLFSNAQMAGEEQTKDVQIDAQVLHIRKGGRMTQI